jgi:hypothetical protein
MASRSLVCFASWIVLLNLCTCLPTRVLLGAKEHKYKQNDGVKLYASKVGPFTNPRWVRARCCSINRVAVNDKFVCEQRNI